MCEVEKNRPLITFWNEYLNSQIPWNMQIFRLMSHINFTLVQVQGPRWGYQESRGRNCKNSWRRKGWNDCHGNSWTRKGCCLFSNDHNDIRDFDNKNFWHILWDSLIIMFFIFIVNHCTVGNLLFWQSLRISECIPDTIVF